MGARPGYTFKSGSQGLGYYREAPTPSAPPAAASSLLEIVVPPGVFPGQAIQVQAPSGARMQVVIPPGLGPGSRMRVQLPPA